MSAWIIVLIVFVSLVLIAASFRVVKQYEWGAVFCFGRLAGVRWPGLNMIPSFIGCLRKVSLRIVAEVFQPQEVITRDNVMVKVDAWRLFLGD